jgi:hypothetical protein
MTDRPYTFVMSINVIWNRRLPRSECCMADERPSSRTTSLSVTVTKYLCKLGCQRLLCGDDNYYGYG